MLHEYSNKDVTHEGMKLIERHDLHNQSGTSDKVYICTLQRQGDVYHATAFYARRGNVLVPRNLAGPTQTIAVAHRFMTQQLNTKQKGGYMKVGYFIDDKAKASASGLLAKEVLEALCQRYPSYATIKSPTGATACIIRVNDNGSLQVKKDDDAAVITIPFGQYGAFEVVT